MCRYHLPLRPIIASGGLGRPWNRIILVPKGIEGATNQDLIQEGQHLYLKLGTQSSGQYSSLPSLSISRDK